MKTLIYTASISTIMIGALAFTNDEQIVTQDDIKNTSSTELRTHKHNAFKRGEILKYRLHYGWINAGEATLEVKNETREFGSRKAYHVVGTGKSTGTLDVFFKVRDRYESYIDEEALAPWLFVRRVEEGGYKINQDYLFNQYDKKVDIGNNVKYDIPEYCQDMVSAFYYARSIDYTNAKEGDIFTINGFIDKEVFPIKIKFVGRETIDSDIGKVKCLKFRPIVQRGRIFKKEEDLNVWITDDKNHIPVRAQAKILVGSVKMDLSGYENLANPLALVK